MRNVKGYVQEIFGSFQGEGPYVGEMHVFVRLSCCSLGCRYCDTPDSRAKQPAAYIEISPGGNILTIPNPVGADVVADAVRALEPLPGFISAVSVTGGEPLEQPEFVADILEGLEGRYNILLETNGTLPEAFMIVRGLVDIVSMDVKLPSVSGLGELWGVHGEFLELCKGKEVIVKAVAGAETPLEEIAYAASLVSEKKPDAVFVIQPLSGEAGEVSGENLLDFYTEAKKYMEKVRVIPQVHKILKVR